MSEPLQEAERTRREQLLADQLEQVRLGGKEAAERGDFERILAEAQRTNQGCATPNAGASAGSGTAPDTEEWPTPKPIIAELVPVPAFDA
ncbi:MAG TPA: hypothetical protein VN790_04165, partial [Steroidobacteraceae bacterium]|nr:hypothetical protein [Steroidobacteraceae bacterium]